MVALHEAEQLSRDMGNELLGRMPWGTHICLFYETKEDLTEVLVPYFKAGLKNNEFCMWITSETFNQHQAEIAMKKAVPNLDWYLEKGQIEFPTHSRWYLDEGRFDAHRVLDRAVEKLNRALTNGYAGIRVAGDEAWLDKQTWRNFAEYEHYINESIGRYQMLVICAYRIDKCRIPEIIDVVNNHQLGLMRKNGQWTLAKNAERKRADERFFEYQEQLRSLVSELSLTDEHERRRIASELHDRVSQSLAASKLKLEMLGQSVAGKELRKALSEICESLGGMITDTTLLASDLSSPILYELGFEIAVAGYLSAEIEKKRGIETEFIDDEQIKPLDDDVRVLVFHDVRELLANIVEHSQATKVKVSIERVGSQMRITIEDNGVGFKPAEVLSKAVTQSGIGLFSIDTKLAHLGGHLEIESAPGCGCKVTIMTPLKRQKTG